MRFTPPPPWQNIQFVQRQDEVDVLQKRNLPFYRERCFVKGCFEIVNIETTYTGAISCPKCGWYYL